MRHGLSFLLIAKGGIVGERVELLHGNVGLNSFMGTSSRHGSSGRWREARRDRAVDTSHGMEWSRGRNIGALTRQLPEDPAIGRREYTCPHQLGSLSHGAGLGAGKGQARGPGWDNHWRIVTMFHMQTEGLEDSHGGICVFAQVVTLSGGSGGNRVRRFPPAMRTDKNSIFKTKPGFICKYGFTGCLAICSLRFCVHFPSQNHPQKARAGPL